MNSDSNLLVEGWAERPIVTLVLLSYNNAPYLEQALRGVFAQTYQRLEIVMTDDCSTDRSFEILEAAAKKYSGPHRIILNRNPKNFGIAGNLNRAIELSTGSIIVLAAGDDISDPTRVEKVVEAFARDPGVRAVVSSYTMINEASEITSEITLPRDFDLFSRVDSLGKNGGYLEVGAAFAYHRDCFLTPGPLPADILCEDCILPMRALALGTIAYRPDSLVRYRRHGASATTLGTFGSRDYGERQRKILIDELDWMHRNGFIRSPDHRKARLGLSRFLTYLALSRHFTSGGIPGRIFTALYHYERTFRRIAFRLREKLPQPRRKIRGRNAPSRR